MLAAVVVASLSLSACGTSGAERVRPLGDSGGEVGAGHAEDALPVEPQAPTTSTAVSGVRGADGAPSDTATDPSIDAVRDLLVRFDRSLGELHDDPSVLLRPDDPVLADFAAVVPAGAVLADDARTQVLDRLSRGESIPAVEGATPYVHHVVTATADGGDRIEFTWCGWSPGVVVDSATGAVVDDAVGHGTGTGVAERMDGRWMLSSLDETSYETLPPRSPDPCPMAGGGS